jgi:pimeloyl-ACP methyl ester carboxylesterase
VPEIELTPGVLEYEDTGGAAPVIVLLHGLLMTGALWDEVVEELRPGFRCIRPTLPMGAHRRAMRAEADLSLRGQVRLLVQFLERLDLNQVTLVFNDWCGAQLLVAERWDARVERLVLASCETYDNYPPGLPGRTAALAAAVPGGLNAALKPLRLKALRRLPTTFGWMSKRPIPDALLDRWLEPAPRNQRFDATCASTPATPSKADAICSRRTSTCRASTSRSWSPGPRRTRSCRPKPAGASPPRFPIRASSRSPTAGH